MVRRKLRAIMRTNFGPALIMLIMCSGCSGPSEKLQDRAVSPNGQLDALKIYMANGSGGSDWTEVKVCKHGEDLEHAILVTEIFDMTYWSQKNPVAVSWKDAEHLVVEVDNGQVIERARICDVAGRKIHISIDGPKKTSDEAVLKEAQLGWEDYYRCHPEIEVEFKMKKRPVSQPGRTP